MRAIALLLILANVCFFFWAHYIDVPEAAPRVAALSAPPAPRLLLAREKAGANEVASVTNELTCISVGPFGADTDLEKIQQRLQDAGFTSAARNAASEVFIGYWVSLPSFATRAEAEQALARLHAAGVSDAYILPETTSKGSSEANVLSLGLFSEQPRAEARRDAIASLGFQPLVQKRTRSGEVHWLDVTLQEPGQLVDPTLLQPDVGGIVRLETTACPAPAAESASASSSTPSTAASSTKH